MSDRAKFYLLWAGEDGLQIAEFESEEAIKRQLEEDVADECEFRIAGSLDDLGDSDNWDEDVRVIIRGSIVKAKPKAVVQSWDFA